MIGTAIPSTGLDLDGCRLLARGAMREVYEHPHDPNLLLKVVRADRLRRHATARGVKAALKRRGAFGPYRIIARECLTYLAVARRAEEAGRPVPIAGCHGIVPTVRGLASACEYIRGTDGTVAPTLHALVEEDRLASDQLAALNAFVADLHALDVVTGDLNARNIVFDAGRGVFVLVDGFGDNTILPLRSWFPRYNARRLDMGFAKIAGRTGLRWDGAARRFSTAAGTG